MPELLLALDVGTTSARVLLIDASGAVKAQARGPVETAYPAPGLAEQDAEAVWRLARDLIERVLPGANIAASDLAAVGVTTQRASLVVWDRRTGAPAGPMVLWNDLRGVERSRALAAAGFPSWPQTPACKLDPDLLRSGGGSLVWGGLESYLVFRLSGGAAHLTDLSNAWLSGYLDHGAKAWNPRILEHQGLDPAIFPTIVDSFGMLASTATSVLGASVPIAAILGDQQAGLFGHGSIEAGGWKASFGTSGTVIASTGPGPEWPHRTMPPEVLAMGGGRTLYCVEGMVITAGAAIDWLCRGLGLFDDAQAVYAAARSVHSSGGVTFRPSLQGLGAPHARFEARGLLSGFSLATRKEHLARAVLEGLAFRVREIVAAMGSMVGDEAPLRIDGGMTADPVFPQILADCLGRPVMRHAIREATAFGAALAAGLGVGQIREAELASRASHDETFQPRLDVQQAASSFDDWVAATMIQARDQ
ncbi:FGGY family carbohydrate kinase [Phenylobacterium montanum]|uniref:Glycerol kinase n=1 Tax=Phenylobacterium montanum TaxID=2823693 RepID=A0A975G1A5_9CAUL|nr:FGGY family carbohydrate kinase [Caulobacter sp. S6]QUD88718.1 hypothetical protein KCG34_02180 [Caulobacter sp. S6]